MLVLSYFWVYLSIIPLYCSRSRSLKIDWYKIKPVNCSGKDIVETDSVIYLNIMLHINAIYEILEEKMEFGMQIYMTEIRENFELNLSDVDSDEIISKLIPDHVIECLWQPDTIFYNAKESFLYGDTLPNRFYKLILPFNYIIRSSRYKIVASCDMDFHLFPMDSQRCSLDISLLASSGSDVVLSWMEPPESTKLDKVNFIHKVKPLNFQINLVNATFTTVKADDNSVSQYLHANFLFVRSLTASIVNAYIPSFLIVCLSMVSFWLDVTAVPGRVTLGVTAILTLSTEIVHIRSSLPTLDYMTAMDIWLLGCVIMVFLSLIEFTMAQSLSRKEASIKKATRESTECFEKEPVTVAWPQGVRQIHRKVKILNPKKIFARKNKGKKDNLLDRISRVVFPLVMACFTCIYWVHFYNEAYS